MFRVVIIMNESKRRCTKYWTSEDFQNQKKAWNPATRAQAAQPSWDTSSPLSYFGRTACQRPPNQYGSHVTYKVQKLADVSLSTLCHVHTSSLPWTFKRPIGFLVPGLSIIVKELSNFINIIWLILNLFRACLWSSYILLDCFIFKEYLQRDFYKRSLVFTITAQLDIHI